RWSTARRGPFMIDDPFAAGEAAQYLGANSAADEQGAVGLPQAGMAADHPPVASNYFDVIGVGTDESLQVMLVVGIHLFRDNRLGSLHPSKYRRYPSSRQTLPKGAGRNALALTPRRRGMSVANI